MRPLRLLLSILFLGLTGSALGAGPPPGLLHQATQTGSVRVIVTLRLPTRPEGQLGPADAARQQESIAALQGTVLAALQGVRARAVRRFRHIPYLALETDAAGLDRLAHSPWVAALWADPLARPLLAESALLVGGVAMALAGHDGGGQAVAVLDTGVDASHSFLAGKVVAEACYSTRSAAYASSTLCPDGTETSTAPGAGVNCSGMGGCDHGTHVAGIAVGRDPGGLGFHGVAPGASLIPIQVFSRFDSSSLCSPGPTPCILSWGSDQLAALEHVYDLRNSLTIAAVNMSLGGGRYSAFCDDNLGPLKAAIDNLRSVGIATVIASGNDGATGQLSAPACISSAISVGASCDAGGGYCPGGVDTIAGYSNVASFLSLLAPGSLIQSSVPGGAYASSNGTSMAAPHVAGAWALLRQRSPAIGVDTALRLLRDTAHPVDDTRSGGSLTGLPRIDLANLLRQDPDHDDLAAVSDNCALETNPDQRDSNGDGFGNLCDPDLDNDGDVDGADLTQFRTAFLGSSADPDFDGDGRVNFADLSRLRKYFGGPPGPAHSALP